MGTGQDSTCETHQLMCVVCGALPGTTCLDEDLRELAEVHPSRRLTIAERNWRTRNGWEPPELAARRERGAAPARPADPPRARRLPARPLARHQAHSVLCCGGDMSGKANKARRKQERLRQRRQQGQPPPGEPGVGQACPLYLDPPEGALYGSWIDSGSLRTTIAWSEAAMLDRRGADPDVYDLARRMPYLASIYGRMVPVGAAWQLDRHIDAGSLPVQWEPAARSPWCLPPR